MKAEAFDGITRVPYDAASLLAEVEPVAARLLDRHLHAIKEWFPHEFIPYSLGRDYDKEPWTPDQPRLTGVAQTAFEVGLLTEDNLPSYHRIIHKMFSKGDGAWKNWINRWTAEEGRHAIVIRDYLVVTRNIDPVALERGRMQTVLTGYDLEADVLEGLAYTAFQELATRISHQNTGRYSRDPVADKIMKRVAIDENLHMVFYRDALAAMIEVAPSAVVSAITRQVLTFQMPGTGISGFRRKAARMADAGIYDPRIHHDDVLWPLLRYWRVFELEGLDADAERDRQRLHQFLGALDQTARRFEARRDERRSSESEPGEV
jgi:acyl-[acyl-carrier-protein] desaturase